MFFFSKGKLLITGEYVVLKGAKAFAIPTGDFGQSLNIQTAGTDFHKWESFDTNGKWFETVFTVDLQDIIQTSDWKKARLLLKILRYIYSKQADLFQTGLHFTTGLNYNRNWGFGSSSTLLANLQKWSGISAFDMLAMSFGGSGYDIAVGLEGLPVLYQLQKNTPVWQVSEYKLPDFSDQVWFVYLNKKQSSREAVEQFQKTRVSQEAIDVISKISQVLFSKTVDYKTFNHLIDRHEQILSDVLDRPGVKTELFPDFPGSIKSLGAWGGDFIMATGSKDTASYFYENGYKTILNWRSFLGEK